MLLKARKLRLTSKLPPHNDGEGSISGDHRHSRYRKAVFLVNKHDADGDGTYLL